MNITVTLSIQVDRIEGKFASKDELREQLVSELEGAVDGMSLEGDNEGQYEVTSVEVID